VCSIVAVELHLVKVRTQINVICVRDTGDELSTEPVYRLAQYSNTASLRLNYFALHSTSSGKTGHINGILKKEDSHTQAIHTSSRKFKTHLETEELVFFLRPYKGLASPPY
jgi:hypothetical protein